MAVRDATSGVISAYHHEGVQVVWRTVALLTTDVDSDDDQVLLHQFPDVAYLLGGSQAVRIKVPDLDSGSLLVWDLGIGDSDGVIDTALITGSTVGRAAGVDEADAGLDPVVDVGGKYLIWDTTTASAGGSGTVEFALMQVTNVIQHAG